MRSKKNEEDDNIGIVKDMPLSGKYMVELTSGKEVMCYVSGMARKPRTVISIGDRVRVEVEGSNGKRGRITYRYRTALQDAETAAGQADQVEVEDES